MCWTPSYTRHEMKTNKAKIQHNMCWTPSYTRHGMKTNKAKIQHNMCWIPSYTRNGMKTNKAKNTTQYVLDTTIRKQTQIT